MACRAPGQILGSNGDNLSTMRKRLDVKYLVPACNRDAFQPLPRRQEINQLGYPLEEIKYGYSTDRNDEGHTHLNRCHVRYVVQPSPCGTRPYLFRQLLLPVFPSMARGAAGTGLRRPRLRWPVIAIFCSSLVAIPSDPEDIDICVPKVERPSCPKSMVCIRQTQGLLLVA